ncbi:MULTISPECIES: hypothetical protein [unclassified Azospirillum]|uniref:hypothetical protein n=1 Tax=unclassified Azospirillum TaxID=2630922 RepID=UPI0018EE6DFC|nr:MULTISPECIES: hypothetical protein [unclassified Azospirillum]
MTAIHRHSTRHDPLPAPETDMVARQLRRRHWAVLALAVLLLAGVLRAAFYLTALTPTLTATGTATAVTDPWGPQLPRPSIPVVQSLRLARLLRIEPPRKKEPAETSVPTGPMQVDPAVRLLVDQGWPRRRAVAIPATARTASIGAVSIAPPPQLTSAQSVPAQLTAETKSASP